MILSGETGGENARGRSAWIFCAAVALIFTLVMLQWSYDRFRLHSAPFLDDVNWMDEGLAMLDAIRDGGPAGLAQHIVQTKTLAPYSIVAATGFALFGVVDWAPYAMNGLLILGALCFIELARRRAGLPLASWFLGAAVLLAFPIAGYSIVTCVGDFASGLFMAIGVLAFLDGWPASPSRIESWAAALAWIFAFYGKATLFPETVALFVFSGIVGYLLSRSDNPPPARPSLKRRWIGGTAVVVLAIAPYYAVAGRNLYDYLRLQNFGALRQVWAFKGTAIQSLLYYVTGFSGETTLGPALYLALALLLIYAVLLLRKTPTEKLRFAALICAISVSYVLPTITVNKTPTVGAPFQFLIVLTGIWCLFRILRSMPRRSGIAYVLTALAVAVLFRFPAPLDARNSPAVESRRNILNGVVDALLHEDVTANESVFFTAIGFLSPNTLRYEFIRRGHPVPNCFDHALSDVADEFRSLINSATYVVATDPGNDEVFYTAPAAFIQGQTLAMVQQNPNFVEVARFSTWRGKLFYLFGRQDRVKNRAPANPPPPSSQPPLFSQGLLTPGSDGMRWTRPEFEIEFPAPRGLYAELKLRFFLHDTSIKRIGPVTLTASIPREGSFSQSFSNEGFHDFTCRYAIQQHLVSTVRVHFHVDKALPAASASELLGLLMGSTSLDPIPRL